ncbi:MAG: glycosyltransferase [Alphaproteobacteria bacterium]|nr:glycosyltransferase [Alphaproteobacteria bacterium]
MDRSLVSVIIPTLDAERTVGAAVASLQGCGGIVGEVIVVDGGSADRTTEIAASSGARVIRVARGRGRQLDAGAYAASGPWLLFLHADTRLDEAARQSMIGYVAVSENQRVAASFALAFDERHETLVNIGRAANWRTRTLSLPYGDQGLLIHRDLYNRVGGFRPLPLMEDVDLVLRLGRHRLTMLAGQAITSGRRFVGRGRRRSARNILCLSLFLIGVPLATVRWVYYR